MKQKLYRVAAHASVRCRTLPLPFAPLGVLAFWVGLFGAARRYPSEYDWRYMTISSLVYPERNPGGYWWAWGGVALCGLGGLTWAVMLARHWRQRHRAPPPLGIRILGLGYASMVACAALSTPLLRVPKGHDLLALIAFVALCIGTVQLTFLAIDRGLRRRAERLRARHRNRHRVYAGILAGAALLPIVLAGITQAYVSHALPQLPWVGLEWRVRGVSMYLSFAFWEWATCVVLSAYTLGLALFGLGPPK